MHLVFVHLGVSPATHLWLNLQRCQGLFPNLPITLIYSDERFIKENNIPNINYYRYSENTDLDSPINKLTHNIRFRNGFWRYSIERLFALTEWHLLHPNVHLIHIESDILLMPNFPFDQISKVEKLAWCRFNETHDVASIVYSPSAIHTEWLTDRINETLVTDNGLTDMTALRMIQRQHSGQIRYLNGDSDGVQFIGEFDAAPYGMWLCGRDPRNHWGFIRRFLELPESDINVSSTRFYFSKDKSLFVSNRDGVKLPLYNLHVHSKVNALFGRKWDITLKLIVLTSRIRFPSSWFSFTSMTRIVNDSKKRNPERSVLQLILKAITHK